jgi:hypothetical protein
MDCTRCNGTLDVQPISNPPGWRLCSPCRTAYNR